MLLVSLLLCPGATAGDLELYRRSVQLVDSTFLRRASLDHGRMLADAAQSLEEDVDWLLTRRDSDGIVLESGDGTWRSRVSWHAGDDLPRALTDLEDAVRAAGRPLPETEVRVLILEGMVRSLDRHSVVLTADGLERFDERLSGTLSGVGATVSYDEDGLYIRELVPDGPAERAGLQVGDRLIRVGGVSTVGMVPADATDRIRGPVGTTVTLLVRRDDALVTLDVRREEISIRNVEASRGPHDVGVITIRHFSEQTRTWLTEALIELEDMGVVPNGLIVDLRGNTGGSLLQSAQAADTFLDEGLIVSTVGPDGDPVPGLMPRMEARAEPPIYDVPMVVLQDASTASGSEIMAGSLALLDRALLVGTTSYGKGTVQKIYQLDEHIKLKLTVAEYLLAGGVKVAEHGLSPDVAVEDVRLSDTGAWYPSPEQLRLPPDTPVLLHAGDGDRALEVAAAIVDRAEHGGRGALRDAAAALASDLRAEDEAGLFGALRERGIDWTPAPTPLVGEPAVTLRWETDPPPEAGHRATLRFTVTNQGPELHRAALRIVSDNPTWDDRVLLVGHLAHGESRIASIEVPVPEEASPRVDRLELGLEADGVATRRVGTHELRTIAPARPLVGVAARVVAGAAPGEARVLLDVTNLGERVLSQVRLSFRFPQVDGIELLDAASREASIAPGSSERFELRLQISEAYADERLPLDLRVESAGAPRLADWALDLPRHGRAPRLSPPVLSVTADASVLPVGTTWVRVAAEDDHLDHVVVWAGTEAMDRSRSTPTVRRQLDKVAWAAGKRRANLEIEVPVAPGVNLFRVVAVDRDGLRTERDLYVFGDDATPAVSAG